MVDKECNQCKKIKRHYAKGLCRDCYLSNRFDKERHKKYVNNWKAKHPEYFRDYYLKNKNKEKNIYNE